MRTRFTCLSFALYNCFKHHEKFRFGFFRFRKCFYWHAWTFNPDTGCSREWIQCPSWFVPSSVSVRQLLSSMRPFVGYEHFFYGDRLTFIGTYIKVKVNTPLCYLFLAVIIPLEFVTHLLWR